MEGETIDVGGLEIAALEKDNRHHELDGRYKQSYRGQYIDAGSLGSRIT